MERVDRRKDIQLGMISAFPIIVGYLPIAMTFGILSKSSGIQLIESFMFSAIVFAGSSQFMALNLITVGAGLGEIILTTLLVNFRHFLMSASLSENIGHEKAYRPLIAFGITDEVFSVVSFRKESMTKEYILTVEALSYRSWVGGTVRGFIIGTVLPETIQESMGIGIYAMYIALLLPEAKKSYRVAMLAILSGLTNTLIGQIPFLPQGWSIILSILLVSGVGCYLEKRGVEVNA